MKVIENWEINKSSVNSKAGVVTSHHYEASDIGADILNSGGNAVDAAIAMGLALGVVEPWMSGIGGCGFMIYYNAEKQKCFGIDFGVQSSANLNTNDYILSESGEDKDLFGWPNLENEANMKGTLSMAVPSYISGISLALKNFGTMSWKELIEPSCILSSRGMLVDWHTTLRIALASNDLKKFESSRNIFLSNGLPPCSEDPLNLITVKNDSLHNSYNILKEEGPDSFYNGALAETIAEDLENIESNISREDLSHYKASVNNCQKLMYKDSEVNVVSGLNAGPTLIDALKDLQSWTPTSIKPESRDYLKYVDVLKNTYAQRLKMMGHENDNSCTTHLSVVDSKGNMVALTQTLLSVFGSKVVLPKSGILMNNGIMWFDPRPNHPNSIKPNAKPLSNMCPVVVLGKKGKNLALGASGGRKIFPAVFQLISFIYDYNMSLNDAFNQPRVDVSGTDQVLVNNSLSNDIIDSLKNKNDIFSTQDTVFSGLFACPNAVMDIEGRRYGAAYIPSPWAKAIITS